MKLSIVSSAIRSSWCNWWIGEKQLT